MATLIVVAHPESSEHVRRFIGQHPDGAYAEPIGGGVFHVRYPTATAAYRMLGLIKRELIPRSVTTADVDTTGGGD